MTKKILFTLLAIACFLGAAGEVKREEIPAKKLPFMATKILAAYFGDDPVTTAIKEKGGAFKMIFEAQLESGTELQFDKDGNWTMVDCKDRPVPERMVPGKVIMFLEANHPDATVVKMERDPKTRDHTITLDNGTALLFDEHFTLLTATPD